MQNVILLVTELLVVLPIGSHHSWGNQDIDCKVRPDCMAILVEGPCPPGKGWSQLGRNCQQVQRVILLEKEGVVDYRARPD